MKILQAVPFFYPAWFYGGPTKVVYELSKILAKNGHEVSIYTTDAFDARQRMPKKVRLPLEQNFQVFYFANLNNFLAARRKLFLPLGAIWRLKNHIKNFDVIHIHDFFNLLTVSAAFFAKFYRKPYVLSVHGTLGYIPLRQKVLSKNLFMKLFGCWIIKNASFLIAHSVQEVGEYEKLDVAKDKIVYLPTGLDWSKYENLPKRGRFRKKYHIPDDTKIILYLGRIHRLKGLDLLLTSFHKLGDNRSKLVVAGSDDGYLPQFRQKVRSYNLENRVLILGITAGREKLQLYIDSDIFVFPSYVLACPLTFMTNLEVLASGLPLVTTADCPNCELESAHAGILVKPSVEELIGGINRFLKDKEKLKVYGKNARKLIRDKYTWERNVSYYERLYQQVLVKAS